MATELLDIAIGAAVICAPLGIAYYAGRANSSQKLLKKEQDKLRELKSQTEAQIESTRRKTEQAIEVRRNELKRLEQIHAQALELIRTRNENFNRSFVDGRKWLCDLLGELDSACFRLKEEQLRSKKNPAIKSADALKEARAEIKRLKSQESFLRYELQTFKEYFPFLETFEQEILEDKIEPSNDKDDVDANYDRARDYLSADEYARMSDAQRSQLALTRYKNRPLSKAQIGRFYERYLGYLYESKGFEVEYFGINEGLEDMGRDLICRLLGVTIIVQAKCWSLQKTIHEKHIYQLFGTITTYSIENPTERVEGHLYTTTKLSDVAREAAARLHIEVHELFSLDKNYPMIKCNIGRDGTKLYHLPFDQQYDRTKICTQGEKYVATVEEAERLGFTRAKRHLFKR